MIYKNFVCIHTKETDADKRSLCYELGLLNDSTNTLDLHYFNYMDWRLTAPNSSQSSQWQDSIDNEIIDKAHIVIALISDKIEDKVITDEIDRVLGLQTQRDIKFLIFFKSFWVNSNDESDCEKLFKILEYKKELRRKHKKNNMDLFTYDNDKALWSKIEKYLRIWLRNPYDTRKEESKKSESTTGLQQIDMHIDISEDVIDILSNNTRRRK